MNSLIEQGLSYIGTIINGFAVSVLTLLTGLLPDADSTIISNITSWEQGYLLSGMQVNSTLNLWYFFDMTLIFKVFEICILIILAVCVWKSVVIVLSLVHKLLDSIPVIG